MFVSFYTELGNSSIADERVFLLHFILQQGIFSKLKKEGVRLPFFLVFEVRKIALEVLDHLAAPFKALPTDEGFIVGLVFF